MKDKYTVVEDSTLTGMILAVNVLIQEGYHPIGDVKKEIGSYMQAMYLHPNCAIKCHVRFHNLYLNSED